MSEIKSRNRKKFKVTIVIPSYRESNRLPNYLETLAKIVPKEMRFIIVDDGSPKEEYEELKKRIGHLLHSQFELRRYATNLGKGAAIEYGFEGVESDWLGFLDADGTISAKDVSYLWNFVLENQNYDLILATRIRMLGKTIVRSLNRHLLSRLFITYFNFLFNIPIYDSQCGFKIFKKKLYDTIKNKIGNKRWLWDTELVIHSYKNEFRCIEIPIDWHEVQGSKINLFHDSIKMAYDLFNIKRRLK